MSIAVLRSYRVLVLPSIHRAPGWGDLFYDPNQRVVVAYVISSGVLVSLQNRDLGRGAERAVWLFDPHSVTTGFRLAALPPTGASAPKLLAVVQASLKPRCALTFTPWFVTTADMRTLQRAMDALNWVPR